MNLPEEKRELLNNITSDISRLDHVSAIVLGGSYATGMATADSDMDIGIYYAEKDPFEIDDIRRIARKYSDSSEPTVTGFYEWGPWVNGGAWITTILGEVDFIYKNIDQVKATISNAKNGTWVNHYEQQPPYGFSSLFFLAETRHCIPLYDPEGIIRELKSSVREYPAKLKQAVIQHSLWSAEFTIWQAGSFARKKDMYNTLGCLTRAVKDLVTALFSMNEIFPLGDKRAIEILEQSEIKPVDFSAKVNAVLSAGKNNLEDRVIRLKLLFEETAECARGYYKPYYKL